MCFFVVSFFWFSFFGPQAEQTTDYSHFEALGSMFHRLHTRLFHTLLFRVQILNTRDKSRVRAQPKIVFVFERLQPQRSDLSS